MEIFKNIFLLLLASQIRNSHMWLVAMVLTVWESKDRTAGLCSPRWWFGLFASCEKSLEGLEQETTMIDLHAKRSQGLLGRG